jgi:type IV secretion system protein VirB9
LREVLRELASCRYRHAHRLACGLFARCPRDPIHDLRSFHPANSVPVAETEPLKQEIKETFMTFLTKLYTRCLTFLLLGLVSVPAFAETNGARIVKYAREDVVAVHAKVRFSTLIVLPENEEILDFTTGDREFWIINGAHNLCYIHPAQAGIKSNLNLITASGHVYSFLLTEISSEAGIQPDLKLFVEPKDQTSAATALHGYVRAGDAEAYKKEMETVHAQAVEQVHAAESHAADEINRFRASYATKLHFDYTLDPKLTREPFLVSAIYHDDSFTYIRCEAREKPVLYEVKDGKPNLISFQVENGVYVAPKILDSAYLALGKKKLVFTRAIAGK